VMTDEVIQKLEHGFVMGYSDREASIHADIAPSTLSLYCKENPEFSERKELLKEKPKMKAKKTIEQNLDKPDTAKWYLERKDPEFKPKSQTDVGITTKERLIEMYTEDAESTDTKE